jgi:putative transposase
MAQNYTELYVQLVFAVKRRRSLIKPEWEGKLFAYITGIIQNRKHELIIINGVEDHVHILIRIHPSQAISDLIRDIKSNSSRFVNDNHFVNGAFEWQLWRLYLFQIPSATGESVYPESKGAP